jgi:hypothetical protein
MTGKRVSANDPKITSAIEEIEASILARYPDAHFEVFSGDDPEGVYLLATVDIEDVEEVTTLYIDRLVDLQVEERLPLFVISLQPFERVVADQESDLAIWNTSR